MKKKHVLFIISTIIIICIIFILVLFNKKKQNNSKTDIPEQNIEVKDDDSVQNSMREQKIENLKEDLGYNGLETQMYEIKKEYDGREVLAIKPNIQYNVAMAGAIKNQKPNFSEIDKILEQAPNKSGIWITKNSREKFLNMLEDVTTSKYTIDNKGFLIQEDVKNNNEIDENIKKAINGNILYSIDINKVTYLVDEVTGQIEEYPFEEIDPESPYEIFETENASLYVITENTYKKLDNKYIIEEILNNMKD